MALEDDDAFDLADDGFGGCAMTGSGSGTGSGIGARSIDTRSRRFGRHCWKHLTRSSRTKMKKMVVIRWRVKVRLEIAGCTLPLLTRICGCDTD